MSSIETLREPHAGSGRLWRFAGCEFDELRRELRVQGAIVELEAKPLDVLRQLVLRGGEVVTKEELLEAVWPGLVVVDASLATAVSKLRKALGDSDACLVLTVPRVGYRLGVPVELVSQETPKIADSPVQEGRRTSPFRNWKLMAVIVLGVVGGAGGLYRHFRSSGTAPKIVSIAVLPLVNMSGDHTQDYLAEGMTEELITELSKIKALTVISRTSIEQYKGTTKPIPIIAQELNVDAVVEGAVLRSGNQIRFTAQLIDARKDAHLWAESYDRDLADVLTLQRELARKISRAIDVAIRPSEAKELAGSPKVNPEAHELYLRGRFFWNQRTADSMYRAADYFRQAIEIDPNYASGYAGLADTYIELVSFAAVDPSEGFRQAEAAARKAIELDDSLAEAHASLAYVRALHWDWAGSQREFQRALQLNPGYIVALYEYAYILSSWGRQTEAVAFADRALELDPLSPIVLYRAGRIYFHGRDYPKAEQLYRRVLKSRPDDEMALYGLGLIYEAEGKYAEAIKCFEPPYRQSGFDIIAAYAAAGDQAEARRRLSAELSRLQGEKAYIRPGYLAEVYTNLGDKDEAFRWLEKGYREHDVWMCLLRVWPRFDPLRSDPRFQDLLRRMNFPPAQ